MILDPKLNCTHSVQSLLLHILAHLEEQKSENITCCSNYTRFCSKAEMTEKLKIVTV